MIIEILSFKILRFCLNTFNKNSAFVFRIFVLFITGIFFYVNLSAQNKYDPIVPDRINNVENSLVGWAQIKDSDYVK